MTDYNTDYNFFYHQLKLISASQFGFRKRPSICDALPTYVQDFQVALNAEQEGVSCYCN